MQTPWVPLCHRGGLGRVAGSRQLAERAAHARTAAGHALGLRALLSLPGPRPRGACVHSRRLPGTPQDRHCLLLHLLRALGSTLRGLLSGWVSLHCPVLCLAGGAGVWGMRACVLLPTHQSAGSSRSTLRVQRAATRGVEGCNWGESLTH